MEGELELESDQVFDLRSDSSMLIGESRLQRALFCDANIERRARSNVSMKDQIGFSTALCQQAVLLPPIQLKSQTLQAIGKKFPLKDNKVLPQLHAGEGLLESPT